MGCELGRAITAYCRAGGFPRMGKEQRDETSDCSRVTEPLIEKDDIGRSTEGSTFISLLSTGVAVLGSFQIGLCVSKFPIWVMVGFLDRCLPPSRRALCVIFFFLWCLQIGYTSPTQLRIVDEFDLSLSEVSFKPYFGILQINTWKF